MKYPSVDFKDIQIKMNDAETRVEECIIDGVQGVRFNTGNRRVFRFGNKFVVKFDSAHNLGRQNDLEVVNYKKIAESDKKYFASILRTGEVQRQFFIVQEYVKSTRRAFKKESGEFEAVLGKYCISDAYPSFESKDYHHNVAFTSKGFKIFDLGYEKSMPNRSDETFEGNPNQGQLF